MDRKREILESEGIAVSAPCRVDMGGTLDISTFHYPLRHLLPCTFNIAVDLRTEVRLLPHEEGLVKVSSTGFESAAFPLSEAPFDHPLGLMFAVAACFNAGGIHIVVNSSSPPRSALGGSSVAAVALVAAFSRLFEGMGSSPLSRRTIALLGHEIEGSVAGVPCGIQDHLAAVYGGANAWCWHPGGLNASFKRRVVVGKRDLRALEPHLLLAYGGSSHESRDVNAKWVKQFVSGQRRKLWEVIAACTGGFVDALGRGDFAAASALMNREVALRQEMTPEVLDDTGRELVGSAVKHGCGARFTGAGGGGCIWALGPVKDIAELKRAWGSIVSEREHARLLDMRIDSKGLVTKDEPEYAIPNEAPA